MDEGNLINHEHMHPMKIKMMPLLESFLNDYSATSLKEGDIFWRCGLHPICVKQYQKLVK